MAIAASAVKLKRMVNNSKSFFFLDFFLLFLQMVANNDLLNGIAIYAYEMVMMVFWQLKITLVGNRIFCNDVVLDKKIKLAVHC